MGEGAPPAELSKPLRLNITLTKLWFSIAILHESIILFFNVEPASGTEFVLSEFSEREYGRQSRFWVD